MWRHVCVPEEGGWVRFWWEDIRKKGGQGFKTWWTRAGGRTGGLGQGRGGQRGLPQKWRQRQSYNPLVFFHPQTLVCAKGWQRAHLWLTKLSVVSSTGGSLLGRLIRGLWKIACSWALIFSACLRNFLALRMAGTPLRSRWAAFRCHTSYLAYFTVTCCFLGTSYCGVQAKIEEKGKRRSEFIRSDKKLFKCLL